MNEFRNAIEQFMAGKMSAEDLVKMIDTDQNDTTRAVGSDSADDEMPAHGPKSTAALYSYFFDFTPEQQNQIESAMNKRFGH